MSNKATAVKQVVKSGANKIKEVESMSKGKAKLQVVKEVNKAKKEVAATTETLEPEKKVVPEEVKPEITKPTGIDLVEPKPVAAEGQAKTDRKAKAEVKPLEFHEAANIFPMIEGTDFQNLVEDIKRNGQREPIITYQGKILDGRNRYRACLSAGVQPMLQEWDGKGSPINYVISLNLHRRHLNETQRADIATEIEKLFKEEAKDNMVKGGKGEEVTEKVNSRKKAAEAMKVSEGSIAAAKQVKANGSEKLQDMVKKGDIAVSTAAELTKLSREEQDKVLEGGKAEIIKKAKELKAAKKDNPKEQQIVDPEEAKEGIFKALRDINNLTKECGDIKLLNQILKTLEQVTDKLK